MNKDDEVDLVPDPDPIQFFEEDEEEDEEEETLPKVSQYLALTFDPEWSSESYHNTESEALDSVSADDGDCVVLLKVIKVGTNHKPRSRVRWDDI